MQCQLRLKKELERFQTQPYSGISCWQTDDVYQLKASILGPDDTPYENGVFCIDIQIPERYPFVPPNVRFVTPIYHPNIDDSGRICLDTLKLPPQGSWKPSLNLSSILMAIQLLMGEPNFNDPLMNEIAQEYQMNQLSFVKNAKDWTSKHARKNGNMQSTEELAPNSCTPSSSTSTKHFLECTDVDTKRKRLV